MEPPGPLKAVPGKRQELRSLLLLGLTVLVLLFLLIALGGEMPSKAGKERGTGSTDTKARQIQSFGLAPSKSNAKGETLDPWGTPLQFSVGADGELRARSAGPDQVFGTADDVSAEKDFSLR
ncbi:MAG TPA: hypothetical protein VHY09_10650 [Candidatus Methylacidiphilales bacterium]|jgi:hypothetical protein|nr:hypothetical protein [Candidatus Methylacidiphilales bacterium]